MRWPWIRAARLDALMRTLDEEVKAHSAERIRRIAAEQQIALEITRRVSMETTAHERGEECLRVREDLRTQREEYRALLGEKLKSLDALNVKLMTERAPEQAPDMTQFHAAAKAKNQVVERVRQQHREMDMALLHALHPKFKVTDLQQNLQQSPEGPPIESEGGVGMANPGVH